MRGILTDPVGLRYETSFISSAEEVALVRLIESCGTEPFRLGEHVAKRLVKSYGVVYDWERREVRQGEPMPPQLEPLRRRAAELAGVPEGAIVQVLLQKYPKGAGIGWHRDKPAYGTVVGISLGSYCIMQFQRGTGTEREVYERALNPRSAYVLAGEVREQWEHHIPELAVPRYSITFRTLAR